MTNTDNDAVGITVTPTTGLTTTEAGGTATFTVVLNTQPTANVTIGAELERHDGRHGRAGEPDLHGRELERGADGDGHRRRRCPRRRRRRLHDRDGGGDRARTSTYNGLNAADVTVTNTDNDAAGITVTPTAGLTTTEAGGTATFTVVLKTQPTADVTIALSSSDTTEGTVSPASLTFTAANWNMAQTVTVTGVDDALDDGDDRLHDRDGAGDERGRHLQRRQCRPTSRSRNTDNDAAGITVTPTRA